MRHNSGNREHLIDIFQPVDTKTVKADVVIKYNSATSFQEYASIEPLSGRELVVARGMRPDISHKIKLLHNAQITHRSLLRWMDDNDTARYFRIGPTVDDKLKHIEVSYYAIEIIGDNPEFVEP